MIDERLVVTFSNASLILLLRIVRSCRLVSAVGMIIIINLE